MTTPTDPHTHFLAQPSHARAPARNGRDARTRRSARTPALCAALLCAGGLWADATPARTPRAPRAASTPSTAQILAPSTTAVPDALPSEQRIFRCGNTYSAQSCDHARPLDVADPRTAGQRLQADDVAARDKRLAAWLEAGRREREGAASEPRKARTRAAKGCVESAAVACEIRKPKVRRAKAITPAKAASASGK